MSVKIKSISWSDSLNDDKPDNYWKLRDLDAESRDYIRYQLTGRGFYSPSASTKLRLIDLYHRMQKGLISYDSCLTAELKKFVSDRGVDHQAPEFEREKIHRQTRQKIEKRALISTLEEGDELVAFEKFAELPPELRSHIYQLYFQDLQLPLCPAQPPITRVSRLLRNESLPLFYSTCTFQVKFSIVETDKYAGPDMRALPTGYVPPGVRYKHNVRFDPATLKFFTKAEESHVRRIQSFRIPLFHNRFELMGWGMKLKDSQHSRGSTMVDETTTVSASSQKGEVHYYSRFGDHQAGQELLVPAAKALAKVGWKISEMLLTSPPADLKEAGSRFTLHALTEKL